MTSNSSLESVDDMVANPHVLKQLDAIERMPARKYPEQEKLRSSRHFHSNLAISYREECKGDGALAMPEKDFAAQPTSFPTRIDKDDSQDAQRNDSNGAKGEASLDRISNITSDPDATSLPSGVSVNGAPNL
ncbi:hypothetical protein E6O75_ATG03414 [Venturia nashicola]|uniref:Uncharacterized protein n=1 Tax=Venturia nashicola TaxID=86259 RepID=A0A4Z1P7P1_9PEZI|nr:hypothetical protein E6O75_ATG03414 [Venturia nashicola]